MPTVYLAGPIRDQTVASANDWRSAVASALLRHGIKGISPLRCEPPGIEGIYAGTYDDPKFGTLKAIASKNVYDTKACDLALIYLPDASSVGTIIELALAYAYHKPVVLVTTDERLLTHPLVRQCAGWCLPSLDDAVELIVGLLRDY
jgi:nucleoside 2-deoxyribosyltransferase